MKGDRFKKKDIDKYLLALSELIIRNGLGIHRILLVGGAAVAVKYRISRETMDIDICYREQNKLNECADAVAKMYGLNADWMNGAVMRSPSFSYRLFDTAEIYKVYGDVLYVYTPRDIDLLCMKLVAFRPKDRRDLIVIAKRLNRNMVTKRDIECNFIRLYDNTYKLSNEARRFIMGYIKR